MTKPLTPKQEKFAQNVASGMTYADSYRDSYSVENSKDESIWCNASQLMSDTKVVQRVDELRETIAEELVYTAKDSFNELNKLHNMAIEGDKKEINNAIKAVELKGKLCGLYVDKSQIDAKVSGNITVNIVTGKKIDK